jgi:hypothetical protein
MLEKFYYAAMAANVIVCVSIIIVEKRRENRTRDKVVYYLARRADSRLVSGVLWLVLFAFWLSFFLWQAQKVYRGLGDEYFQDVFQLLNPSYLEALRSYFFESQMISKLIRIRFYQSGILNMLLWIVISGCLAVTWLFRSRQRDAVCHNGIVAGGRLYKWDKVVGYGWGKRFAKKWLGKEVWYHELTIEVRHGKWSAKILGEKTTKVTLRVEEDNKESIGSYLNGFVDEKSRGQAT